MDPFVFVPIIILVIGVLSIIYPKKIGVAFCRMGKATWRTATFGLTDMHWFYPEEKAPKIFRMLGISFVIFSIIFLGFSIGTGFGPNSFNAMSQARSYLKDKHGKADSWSMSTTKNTINSEDPTIGYCIIEYEYGKNKGALRGKWTTDERFIFEEYVPEEKQISNE